MSPRVKEDHDTRDVMERTQIDRRTAIQGGLLLTAAASGTFAPAVKASTRAKAFLSADGPIITDVDTLGGEPGTLVTVNGTGFPADFADLCCTLESPNGDLIGMNVINGNETQFQAEVQDFEPRLAGVGHTLTVRIGDGVFNPQDPPILFPNVEIRAAPWVWGCNQQPPILFQADFVPRLADPVITPKVDAVAGDCFVKNSVDADGKVRLTLTKDWPEQFTIEFTARALKPGLCCDTNFSEVVSAGGLGNPNATTCAVLICNLIRDAFNNHPTKPLDEIDCQPDPSDGSTMVLECRDGSPITAGYLRVKVISVP